MHRTVHFVRYDGAFRPLLSYLAYHVFYAIVRSRMVGAMVKIMLLENVEHRKRRFSISAARHTQLNEPLHSVACSVCNFLVRKRREIKHRKRIIHTYGKVFERIENRTVKVEYV